MRTETEHRDDDEMGIGAKLTLGLILWKVAKGVVKIGAMAGAAILGWRVATRMFDRATSSSSESTEAPVIA
jgi:hypothetical protein